VLSNSSGRVDETRIRAAIVGDDVEVLVPLEKVGRALSGAISVTLRDAARDRALGTGEKMFDQADDRVEYRVVIAGARSASRASSSATRTSCCTA
jgi:predicted ATPase